MTDREVVKKTRMTSREAAELSRMADRAGKSESALLRQAFLEYLDKDRAARVEDEVRDLHDKVDRLLDAVGDTDEPAGSHTHMDHERVTKGSPASEKLRAIVERLRENTDNPDGVVQHANVVRAIEDYAGIDDRTKRKYTSMMRRRGLLYEHPGNPEIWTFQTDTFIDWLRSYASLNGPGAAEEVLDQYDVEDAGGTYDIDGTEVTIRGQ